MNLCPHCFGEEIADNICSVCGWKYGDKDIDEHALPRGTKLSDGRYTVGGVLSQSGFGITYFGYDNESAARVAILEYFPESFAERTKNGDEYSVSSQKGETADSFEKGLNRFEIEAKKLLRFQKLPGFVSVCGVIIERGTAYVVMEFIDGELLSSVINKRGGKLSEKLTLNLFLPIIKTLGFMHRSGYTHRDITPDNIMIQKGDGKAVLIDLGASLELTEEGGDMRTTVAMLKYGYAAEELYDRTRVRQGSWTDVYGIAATMINVMAGKSLSDILSQTKKIPFTDILDTGSETVRHALMHATETEIKNRTRTMEQLYSELTGIPVSAIMPEYENKTKYSEDIHILEHPHSSSIVKMPPIASYEGLVLNEQIINNEKTGEVVAYSHERGGQGAGFTIVYTPRKRLKMSFPINVISGRERVDLYGNRCEILMDLAYGENYGHTIIRRTENGSEESGFMFSYNHFATEKFLLTNYYCGEKDGEEFLYDGDTIIRQTYVDGKTSPKEKKTYALMIETDSHKDYIFTENTEAVRYSDTLSFGSISYKNGDYYRGLITDKKAAGPGVCVYANGEVFIGLFSEGAPDGYGLFIKPDGEGLFVKHSGEAASERINIGQIGEEINLLQSPYQLFLDSVDRLIQKGEFKRAAAELEGANVSFTANPKYYWSKLKIHLRAKSDNDLKHHSDFIHKYSDYKNAFKYANEENRRYYESIADAQVAGNEDYRRVINELIPAGKFDKAKDEMTKLQGDLSDYSDYWWTLLKINLKKKTDEELRHSNENITTMIEYINANRFAGMEKKRRYLNIAKSIKVKGAK
jgi:serine/threonine protein kinase